jgi:hypothetical protein
MTFLAALTTPPEPLTRMQRVMLVAGTLVSLITRLLARGHSLWDWDEALFCLGVRNYNVVLHQPHPPGYPLFVGAAKLVRLGVHSDFLALQIVVLLSGTALLPLLFFFAREARFPFATAFGAALVLLFLPNVWIYSGSAMSDIPSLALTLLACALLLRGCRSARAYVVGAICLALAAGIRPQAMMVGIACGLVATIIRWRARRRIVVTAALLGALTVGGIYLGAALASNPPGDYLGVVRLQSRYVRNVDSYHNPGRPSLTELAPLFFYRPVAANAVQTVSILAALGIVAGLIWRRGPTLLMLATFVPFAVFAWLMLDAGAVSRYAVGYMALYALFAADLFTLVSAKLGRVGEPIPHVACLGLAAALAWWTWPAAKAVRSNDTPPVAAARWILRNAYRGAGTIFVHNGMGPFADYFLAGYEQKYFEHAEDVPYSGYVEPGYILIGQAVKATDAQIFVRPRGRLWRIVRQRYFEAAVLPAWDLVRFSDGWHDPESDGESTWRWMKKSSTTMLPSAGARGRLTLRLYVPKDALPRPPTIDVAFNGVPVERFVATEFEVQKSWVLPSRQGAANDLRIITSESIVPAAVRPGGDARELGLKLMALTWQPASQ